MTLNHSAVPHPKPDDDEDEVVIETPLFRRHETQLTLRQISFYLSDEIGPPLAYTDLLNTLRTAGENDMILLHLNTPGGNFDTGLQIINNISASKAHVITVLEARAYSMGAMIFLAGHELIVHDNCQLMFHNYSSSIIGKGNEQHAQVLAIGKWFEKTMSRVCHPFLTRDEIDSILRGEDIWMDSDDIRKRLNKMNQPSKPDPAKALRLKAKQEKPVNG
jgi:ATP-dependent protease ClpP protease subunit